MQLICCYYNNSRRLGLVLETLTKTNEVIIHPLSGTYMRSGKEIKCVGEYVEFLIKESGKSEMILMTTNPAYEGMEGNLVDVDISSGTNLCTKILSLCKSKFEIAGNLFTLECSMNGNVLSASSKPNGNLAFSLRTPRGDALNVSSTIPTQMLSECTAITSFKYNVVTNTAEREVAVKRGTIEVFREIAHYLNRALYFTTIDRDGKLESEYIITSTGCCTVERSDDGEVNFYKVPFTAMEVNYRSSVAALDVPLDALMRAENFGQVFRR